MSEVPPPPPPHEGRQLAAPNADQPLAPEIVTLWRAASVVPVVVTGLPSLALAAAIGGALWLAPLAVLAVGFLTIVVLPPLRYRRWRWRMTDRALELEQGVLFRQVRALPYFRIQHIDVEHGPLDRWLGLARLEVHTASVTATLPGLAAGDAPRLRAALLLRAGESVAAADRDDDAV